MSKAATLSWFVWIIHRPHCASLSAKETFRERYFKISTGKLNQSAWLDTTSE